MSNEDLLRDRFRRAAVWAHRSDGLRGAWPTFEEAAYDDPNRIVYGHCVGREPVMSWADVPAAEYGPVEDDRRRIVAAHDVGLRRGHAHGFPTFHEADHGGGVVFGTVFLAEGAGVLHDVFARDLGLGEGDPTTRPMVEWFRGAARVAYGRGYVGGLPNGNYASYPDGWRCGVVMVPAGGSIDHVDVRGRDLGLSDRSDPPTGPNAAGERMLPGQILAPGTGLTSANGAYSLVFDGGLTLWSGSGISRRSLWSTGRAGTRAAAVCLLQDDGNVVLYDGEAAATWATGTDGTPGAHLVLQDDGNLVLYRSDGSARWSTDTPKIVLTHRFRHLNGRTEVVLRPDGRIRFSGHVRNRRVESRSYRVLVTVTSSNGTIALSMARTGDVGGWQIASDDPTTESWDEELHSPALQHYWAQFLDSRGLAVDEESRGAITGFLGDAAETVLRFAVGGLVLGPAGALVILVGGSLASLALSGSPVPGARIVGGVLWLAGPYGTLFALGAEAVVRAGSRSRELTDDEYAVATAAFGDTLPERHRIVVTDSLGVNRRPFVFPRFDGRITMNLGAEMYDGTSTRPGVFLHEMAHVWQIHHSGDLLWIAEGMAQQICQSLGSDVYSLEPGPSFQALGLEQQATIMNMWVADQQREISEWFPYVRDFYRRGRTSGAYVEPGGPSPQA